MNHTLRLLCWICKNCEEMWQTELQYKVIANDPPFYIILSCWMWVGPLNRRYNSNDYVVLYCKREIFWGGHELIRWSLVFSGDHKKGVSQRAVFPLSWRKANIHAVNHLWRLCSKEPWTASKELKVALDWQPARSRDLYLIAGRKWILQ